MIVLTDFPSLSAREFKYAMVVSGVGIILKWSATKVFPLRGFKNNMLPSLLSMAPTTMPSLALMVVTEFVVSLSCARTTSPKVALKSVLPFGIMPRTACLGEMLDID
jgi:hypothetical protein